MWAYRSLRLLACWASIDRSGGSAYSGTRPPGSARVMLMTGVTEWPPHPYTISGASQIHQRLRCSTDQMSHHPVGEPFSGLTARNVSVGRRSGHSARAIEHLAPQVATTIPGRGTRNGIRRIMSRAHFGDVSVAARQAEDMFAVRACVCQQSRLTTRERSSADPRRPLRRAVMI